MVEPATQATSKLFCRPIAIIVTRGLLRNYTKAVRRLSPSIAPSTSRPGGRGEGEHALDQLALAVDVRLAIVAELLRQPLLQAPVLRGVLGMGAQPVAKREMPPELARVDGADIQVVRRPVAPAPVARHVGAVALERLA